MNIPKKTIHLALALMIFVCGSLAAGAATKTEVVSWLSAGPFSTPLPALGSPKAGDLGAFSLSELLKFEPVEISSLRPRQGEPFPWTAGPAAAWTLLSAGPKGAELSAAGQTPHTAYLAAYLTAGQWTAAKLTVSSPHPFQAFIDGKSVVTQAASEKKSGDAAAETGRKATADLKLEMGRHLLVLKALRDPENPSPWSIQAGLETSDDAAGAALIVSPWADDRVSLGHVLDTPQVTSIALSDDGSLAALSLSCASPTGEGSEAWLEIYDTKTGKLVRTYRGGMSVSSLQWVPGRLSFSFVTQEKGLSTLWQADLEAGTVLPLLEKVKDLGGHTWAPDGSFLIYSVSEEPEKDPEGVRRFKSLPDRQPWWRRRSFLYKLSIPEKDRQRLTAGDLSTSLLDISPDGKTLLFSRPIINSSQPPYDLTEVLTLDLDSLQAKVLWKGSWFNDAKWSPDGQSLLFLGGPSLFGHIGWNTTKGKIPNEYDIQAYLFDPAPEKIKPLTKDFNPSIDDAEWAADSQSIYFLVTDHSFERLYRYDLKEKAFSRLDCGPAIVRGISLAKNAPLIGFIGNGPNDPHKAYLFDLERKTARLLRNPGQEAFAEVKFGKVEPWSFKNARGREIEGSVYYPPDFDPAKTYPCIVNYYGGTTPTSQDFGGRYPKEYFAAQGYVVYVLQPSGAIGYGQDFSALHVNDWGIMVADEIIDGVKKFLAAHPFVDAKKVGCIGASYGGFMTMLLATRTNIFSAAISHAGISFIGSYWGEGFWGYWYNAVSATGSFPWNRQDIYVNQSPLFHADRIKTPLLLLHGSADTNVPSGESTQLFTALKLLGREVEYIQILDQDHHILDHNKRFTWSRTIQAWFDRWLKGQPAWWNDLYPEKK